MDGKDLADKLADIDEQLRTLFAYHGHNWEAIKRQRKDNAQSQGTRPVFTTAQEHGGVYRRKIMSGNE
jgi:hypothetical protein